MTNICKRNKFRQTAAANTEICDGVMPDKFTGIEQAIEPMQFAGMCRLFQR